MTTPLPLLATHRPDLLARLRTSCMYDLAIIGGGATGLGVALDATLRGLSVVLVDSHDFAQGTSSRATKLVHGGVRYLAQGNVTLVREALRERANLLNNAPHLAQPLPFIMPSYRRWETLFYGLGLKAYDLLAGQAGLGATELLNETETHRLLPSVHPSHLCGGVKYWDGQFDDARLALVLARTAAAHGALLLNYCKAVGLQHTGGKVTGIALRDVETGEELTVQAGCVVNATGVWVDSLRTLDAPPLRRTTHPMVTASQGAHLVVDKVFFPGDHALLVPKTADGRVLFAVPWLGKVILGTTDTPRRDLPAEPEPLADEVTFILSESARYLEHAPTRADIRSMWAGLRPLVKYAKNDDFNTKTISREHIVTISPSGLVTVTGGKWTTYRSIAADVLAQCVTAGLLRPCGPSRTEHFSLIGVSQPASAQTALPLSLPPGLHLYGSEASILQTLPGSNHTLAPHLTEAMVRFAVRHEYARTVEDVLARRNRLLFLDAHAASTAADKVAAVMAEELGHSVSTESFKALS